MGLTTFTLLSSIHTKEAPLRDLPDNESSAKAHLRRILAQYPPTAPTLELKRRCPTQPIPIIPSSKAASFNRRRSSSASDEEEAEQGLYKTRSNELAASTTASEALGGRHSEKNASLVWAEMESERMLWGTFLGLG